jgi:hypothetical protein
VLSLAAVGSFVAGVVEWTTGGRSIKSRRLYLSAFGPGAFAVVAEVFVN